MAALAHFGNGLFQKVITAALRTHDLNGVAQLHPELEAGDVVLGDRAFGSFGHVALLISRGLHGIFRAHQNLIIDFTPGRPHVVPGRGKSDRQKGQPRSQWIQSLGSLDQIVDWFRPLEAPTWLTAETWAALVTSVTVRTRNPGRASVYRSSRTRSFAGAEIAEKIVAVGADYVLAVKGNQPKLHDGIVKFFLEHLSADFALG